MDRRSAVVAILSGSAVLLGGCASPPEWTRSDATPAQVRRDERACQALAEYELKANPPGFTGSPTELYGQNYAPPTGRMPSRMGAALPGPMFDVDPVHRMLDEERISDRCMRAKGYAPREPSPEPAPVEIPDCRKCKVS